MKRLPALVFSRAGATILVLLSCWPVVRWYVARMGDGSDEPWGLAALAAALWFAPRKGWLQPLPLRRTAAVSVLLLLYAVTFSFVPPLVHALLFVVAIAFTTGAGTRTLAWTTLLILSLPLVATLQFYLGYPLRLATSFLSAALLNLGGLRVAPEGTSLRWAGEQVVVDAPCSGIHMVWTGLFVAATLSCWHRHTSGRTWQLLRLASLVVTAANVLRATVLFCTETKLWPAPAWMHEGVGLGLFGAAATVLVISASRRAPAAVVPSKRGGEQQIGHGHAVGEERGHRAGSATASQRLVASLAVLTLLAAAIPFIGGKASQANGRAGNFPGWEAAPVPAGLSPVELTARDLRFARDFPGQLGAFTDGTRTWLVRWVALPTRKLHPAGDCLRALGFTITPGPICLDGDGTPYGSLRARRGEENLRVREHILDARGAVWTDVSAWFWHAALGKAQGPWWAVTILGPE